MFYGFHRGRTRPRSKRKITMFIISVMSVALVISLVGSCFAHKLGSLPYRVVTTPLSIQFARREKFARDITRVFSEHAAAERAAASDVLAAQLAAASRRMTASTRFAEFMASDSNEVDPELVGDLDASQTAMLIARCYTC